MSESNNAFKELLARDNRYKLEAYAFVFDALRYAHETLKLGAETPADKEEEGSEPANERHVTGQELCEAIRQYALDQYGYMAKVVLNNWGVTTTGDFGEIVFNLIGIGKMRKTPSDRREDFDDVFDFDTGLVESFQIRLPEG